MWDDDEFGDDDDDYDPEEDRKKLEALPIYQKAMEIYDLTKRITDTFDKDEVAAPYREIMLEDCSMIPVKIAGAEAMDDYILKMENAVVIKLHARSLFTQTSAVAYLTSLDEVYLQLLRDEIEEFRLLFREWTASFQNNSTKEGDGWGLFVPDDES